MMDAVGRALLEQDDPGTFRIPTVDYSFDVSGETLQELGTEAHRKARALYGKTPFKIVGMSVAEFPGADGLYLARVHAEVSP